MKTLAIRFPDGVREWPARERFKPSTEIPAGPGQIVFEPVPDPEWGFQAVLGGWRAIRN